MARKISAGDTFRINGFLIQPEPGSDSLSDGGYEIQEVYRLTATRSESTEHTITLNEHQLVEFVFEDNTTWFGDKTMIAEMLEEPPASRATIGIPLLPIYITNERNSRGLFDKIKILFLRIFVKKAVTESITAIATRLENKILEGRTGLFRLGRNFEFIDPVFFPGKPLLVLIHGTAASTDHSFRDLIGTPLWTDILEKFDNEVYCFQHMTLIKGPLENAIELLQQLPSDSAVSFLTTSRGGYIGELLVRFTESAFGFSNEEVELFKNAGRNKDVEKIESLRRLAKEKNIRVEKFIRIACAAQGTSLLSKRLDFFLNTLINLITAASVVLGPVVSSVVGLIKSLIGAVLEEKNNPDTLPGLEIQNPNSLFIKVLNSPNNVSGKLQGFNNKLVVIAGSAKFSLNLRGLAILLLKLVYGNAKNDLMVNTESMYQGAIREGKVLFFLDEGNNVSHFNYFKNKPTQDAIKLALMTVGPSIPGFQERELRLPEFDKRGVFGIPGGRLMPEKISGKKPIIILLPGIMGSALEHDNDYIWLNLLQIPRGAIRHLRISEKNVKATALIKSAYVDLYEYFSVKYDVLLFPFDWRLSVTESAAQLNSAIVELFAFRQQIQIIAHSMGGLVARELIIHHRDTWTILNSQPQFIFMMLGTPWMGSYRIPYLAAGKDSIVKTIDNFDPNHSRGELIDMFVRYPGLLNLLPLKGEIDFSDVNEWKDLQTNCGYGWSIPGIAEITQFAAFKKAAIDADNLIDYSRIIYIAGKGEQTIQGYAIVNGELQFESTTQGDESVTWELGIPAKLKQDSSLYYVNATHGKLASSRKLFRGIAEILETGKTTQAEFSKSPIADESNRSIRDIELIEYDNTPVQLENSILGLGEREAEFETRSPILKVNISYGDLLHSAYPVLIGHFAKDGILNAESVADKYLKNALTLKHRLRIYPNLIGTNDFFESESSDFFNGCIIVGLGQVENLSAFQLMITTEKAVANYLLTYAIKKFRNTVFSDVSKATSYKIGLSSLIIGANYGGLSMEHSVRAIMQGVVNANIKVTKSTGFADLYVDHLEFVELFEDKAIQCFTSLDKLIKGNSDNLNLVWKKPRMNPLLGARRRLMDYDTSSWWQRLSVHQSTDGVFSFYSATNTSREERQDIHNNVAIIEELIESISLKDRWSHDSAKAIFNLLIPTNFKENISRNSHVLWVLDTHAAAFPWELLQTGGDYDKPLCIGAGMIRQLAISEYRPVTGSISTKNVLIIGDPDLAGFTKARQLDGAKREAEEVAEHLQKYAVDMEPPLIRSNHNEIVQSLFKKEYMIVHLSGHGIFDPTSRKNSGMLIGKKKGLDEPMLLTADDIAQLPSPPEFVFVNCCHLGRVHPFAEELSSNRNKLAANIGTELIRIGVKAVIVAGWEVDDAAAKEFAIRFYDSMLDDDRTFGDAVLEARKYVYDKYFTTNTWGAFQCYGDPHYRFPIDKTRKNDSAYTASERLIQQLESDLDKIISCCDITYYKRDRLLNQLTDLEKEMVVFGDDISYLLEKLASAYIELGNFDLALEKLELLFGSGNAKYDLSSREMYYEIITRRALSDIIPTTTVTMPKAEMLKIIRRKKPEMSRAIRELEKLNAVTKSVNGYMYLGNMYRGSAVLQQNSQQKYNELVKSIDNYFKAWKLSLFTNDDVLFNLAVSKIILSKMPRGKWEDIPMNDSLVSQETVIEILNKKSASSNVEYTDVRNLTKRPMYELFLLIQKMGEGDENKIVKMFKTAWKKAGSPNKRIIQQETIKVLENLFRGIKTTVLLADKLKYISQQLENYVPVF